MCINLTRRLWLVIEQSLLFFSLLLISVTALSNNPLPAHVVEGTVKATNRNEPLEGANVIIKGTNNGTTTARDGSFRITAERTADTLVISSIGYVTQEIPIRGRSVIDVDMVEESKSLDGVVIVGYTSQRMKDLTSAVGSADVSSMQKKSVTDVALAQQ